MMEQLVEDIEKEFGVEAANKTRDVVTVVTAKVRAKNLFGWRYFIEDALIETISHMIRTEFRYSGGAYVACGMQAAIDKCRYCNAKKRRHNYEMLSLDDEELHIQASEGDEKEIKDFDVLCMDIAAAFGEALAKELRPFLAGNDADLSRETLKQIRSAEFKSWFAEYMERR